MGEVKMKVTLASWFVQYIEEQKRVLLACVDDGMPPDVAVVVMIESCKSMLPQAVTIAGVHLLDGG